MMQRLARLTRGPWLVGILLLTALLVRCWDLNARSLWFDEAGEYWVATSPLPALMESVRTGSGDPPLYAFLLHVWLGLGSSVIWIRALSVIASVAGVAGVMTLAYALAGRRAMLAAGVMLVVLPADIRYAQEAGQYALMLGAVAWNLVALQKLWTGPTRRTALIWALTALVASYAYYGAVIAIALPFACAGVEALLRRDRARVQNGLLSLSIYAVGILPLALWILPAQLERVIATDVSSAGTAQTAWGVGAIATWLNQVLAFQFSGWPYTRVPALLPVAATLLLLVLAARTQRRALVWLGATWMAHWVADRAGLFPYGFRWGLILQPLLVAVVACGLPAARGRWTRTAARVALAGLVVSGMVSLPNRTLRDTLYASTPWPWPETEDLRAVLTHWRAGRAAGEPTYIYYGAAPAFAYYARDDAWAKDLTGTWYLDCWHNTHTQCGSANVQVGHWWRDMNDTQRVADVFRTLGGTPDSFWIVFSHLQINDDRDLVANLVANGYRIQSAYQATGAAVFYMKRT
jgi:hypothetical protein